MIRIAVLVIMISCELTLAQEVITYDNCDSIAHHLTTNWKSLKPSIVKKFLETFSDSKCQNNVEYSEYANEILFHLIDEHPKACFTELFTLSTRQIRMVADEILYPINDGIPVDQIYERLKKAHLLPELKNRALKFMMPTFEKQRKMIDRWEKANKKKWSYPPWQPL
jgi:hypothetical protein